MRGPVFATMALLEDNINQKDANRDTKYHVATILLSLAQTFFALCLEARSNGAHLDTIDR